MRHVWHVFAGVIAISAMTGSALDVLAQTAKSSARRGDESILARVDGQPITRADLERMFKSRRVDLALQPKVRGEFIDQLIDTQLMQRFLKLQKIAVSEGELDGQVAQIKALLPKSASGQLDLKEHGYTEKILREELTLPLLWRNYLIQTVSDQQIKEYFEAHRVELDGTEVRASQIFVKVADLKDPQQVEAALAKLSKIRKVITDGLDFATAATKYSEAPSGKKGGDVGFFLTEGKMPRAFTKVAFALQPGEMSEPFASPFGTHLCLVTDRHQGEKSIEDVRPQIMQAISTDLQLKKLQELRAKAKIERFDD
ncbi:MAG: peptidylprolyl isomerase [Planctomycetota bacterium]